MDDIPLRYTQPTRLDSAPTGTVARVSKEEDEEELYIQVGTPEEPHWISMGTFLEKALKDRYTDKDFITQCLKTFNDQDSKS